MTHRPVHSPVPRYARTGYPGRPPALGSGLKSRSTVALPTFLQRNRRF